jgi:hypothetical protein
MSELSTKEFAAVYADFQAPIAALNCGDKCAPYNERGVPFCCDTRHAVPSAYKSEWGYLKVNTDLWHLWEAGDARETQELRQETPDNQVLVECQGHLRCQRGFRTLTCRAFPFFPYVNREGEFLGLSYYWEFEERCWVISNLQVISPEYRAQFCATYENLFARMPDELENFRHHSNVMRRIFGRRHRAIPLLHRNGKVYKVSPRSGRMRRIAPEDLPKFGPYKIAAELPFPDELEPVGSC